MTHTIPNQQIGCNRPIIIYISYMRVPAATKWSGTWWDCNTTSPVEVFRTPSSTPVSMQSFLVPPRTFVYNPQLINMLLPAIMKTYLFIHALAATRWSGTWSDWKGTPPVAVLRTPSSTLVSTFRRWRFQQQKTMLVDTSTFRTGE